MTASACRLYLITPPRIDDPAAFGEALKAALDAGDVAVLQIRLKDVDDAGIAEVVRVKGFAAEDIVLNDRPDLAVRLGCDGVHIGQDDASYAEARRIMGSNGVVGVTCHDSRHLAMEAAEAGADYVAFGAFFPTATKAPLYHAEPELLTVWQEVMQTPCVAIGGITAANARGLAAAGADFLAVSAGVWAHPEGPAEAVRALNAEIAEGVKARRT